MSRGRIGRMDSTENGVSLARSSQKKSRLCGRNCPAIKNLNVFSSHSFLIFCSKWHARTSLMSIVGQSITRDLMPEKSKAPASPIDQMRPAVPIITCAVVQRLACSISLWPLPPDTKTGLIFVAIQMDTIDCIAITVEKFGARTIVCTQ